MIELEGYGAFEAFVEYQEFGLLDVDFELNFADIITKRVKLYGESE